MHDKSEGGFTDDPGNKGTERPYDMLAHCNFGARQPRMRARVLVVWVLLACTALAMPASVYAQAVTPPPDSAEGRARESFSRGRIHYENGEFEAAALAFEEAYGLS